MLTIKLQPFPVLLTKRLELREISEDDAEEFFWLRNSEEVMKYIQLPKLETIEKAKERIKTMNEWTQKNEAINWGITLKEEKIIIGWILYKNIDLVNHSAEVGYLLHPDFWRKGIIQEALTEVLDFGFNILKFHRIQAVINPDNNASELLLKKNGFVKEALFRENFYYDGMFLDSAVYSLLKSDNK